MFLDSLPLIFVLVGLVLYVVLGGADYGAGAWRLFAGTGEQGSRIRDHAQHSMGPVWEANHVWLIFVLTVTWTAYPRFLGSLASTLAVPLFLAAIGIVVRGASYALRSAASSEREIRTVDTIFGVVSLLTPFMLGACAGAIAARRVPVGNASGGLFSSWTGPVSIMIGALAVAFSSYVAAVFLTADARRRGDESLIGPMRKRAIISGVLAGGLAIAGLVVLHADAKPLYHGLVHGGGLIALIASGLAGVATLAFVASGRLEAARYGAAVAVAAVIAGWAVARWPHLLPGLTVAKAAAGHDTLVAVIVAVLAGGALLFPSLTLLFALTLRGSLGEHDEPAPQATGGSLPPLVSPGFGLRACVAMLIAGVGLLTIADAGWAHALGLLSLLGFVLVGFAAVTSDSLA